ncbi:MAG TPA: hypothetical protein VIJ71_06520 [Mycobacteriales bacterium]
MTVLVPQSAGRGPNDGAFDLQDIGMPGAPVWPSELSADAHVIVDDLTSEIASLLSRTGPPSVHYLSGGGGQTLPGWHALTLVGGDHPLGVHVPVNRLAERHRHHGFGFTDYLLVLSDRAGTHAEPPPAAAWLSAGFNEADVVVLEDAVASAWRGRALRGKVTVDTRMDFWRLLAHASVCVDLAPGPQIARECIEAMRFGTPIIVPDLPGPGTVHARASGGATFCDASELLDAAASLQDPSHRTEVGAAARRYADAHFGDPASLVRRLGDLLGRPSPDP